jgi:queuine/archaeosine tRNA-ribosyltransferase
MLNENIFNYEEERREALSCHNIALWHKLFKEEQEQIARQEYWHNKFLEDDHNRCTKGF